MASRKSSQFNGYSSNQIKNLNLNMPKVWDWIEWVLSKSCENQSIKKDVAICLLNKALPSKVENNVKLAGEEAYAKRVFERLGIPIDELSDASLN